MCRRLTTPTLVVSPAGTFTLVHRMKRRDGHRGNLPEIRTDQNTITFVLTIALKGKAPKLLLRCERNGEIYASIDATASKPTANS
jgi:hypothetical protein